MRLSEGMNIAAQQRAAAFTVPTGLPSDTALALVFSQGQYYQLPARRPLSELKGWSFARTGARAAEAADGSLTVFESGDPRILPGEGLVVSAGGVNLLSAPEDFTDAAWVKTNGASVSDSNTVLFDGSPAGRVEQSVTGLTAGESYTLSYEMRVPAGTQSLQIGFGGAGDSQLSSVTATNEYVWYSVTFQADGSTEYPQIRCSDVATVFVRRAHFEPGSTASDYIPGDGDGSSAAGADEAVVDLGLQWALKDAVTALDVGAYGAGAITSADGDVPDRSGSGNDAVVNGTLTGAAAASGSGLIMLSGFSASNYLEQAYSADKDMGTGDFAIPIAIEGTDTDGVIMDRDSATTGARFTLEVVGGKARFTVDDGTTTVSVTSTTSVNTGSPVHLLARRVSGDIEILVNKVVEDTADASGLGSLNNASAVTRYGVSVAGANAWGGSLTLPRIIKGRAPTAREIGVLYAKERTYFEADATLPGYAVYPGAQSWDNCGGLNPQDGFTLCVECKVPETSGYYQALSLDRPSGTYADRVSLAIATGFRPRLDVASDGVISANTVLAPAVTPGSVLKMAVSLSPSGDYSFSANGSAPVTGTGVVLPPAVTGLMLGARRNAASLDSPLQESVAQSLVIPRAMSSAELVALSGGSV